jgi:hypothetical protein
MYVCMQIYIVYVFFSIKEHAICATTNFNVPMSNITGLITSFSACGLNSCNMQYLISFQN